MRLTRQRGDNKPAMRPATGLLRSSLAPASTAILALLLCVTTAAPALAEQVRPATRIRLPRFQIDLVLPPNPPDQDFAWVLDPEAPPDQTRLRSTTSDIRLGFAIHPPGVCGDLGPRDGASVEVAGFIGTLAESTGFSAARLCRDHPDRLIAIEISSQMPLGELSRFGTLLSAIERTLMHLPAPLELRPPPPPPLPPDGFLFMQFGSEWVFSSRDTAAFDPNTFPEDRLIGPGLAMDFLFSTEGLLGRTAFTATYDLAGLFGGDNTDKAHFGAAHFEAAIEFGYVAGDDFILGFLAGWTGLSGPLTLNSSLSVSTVIGQVPDVSGGFGWLLCVTPIQLFAANEREFFSPLTVELQVVVAEGLGLSLGFQWIGPPEPGDQDIPAEGFAFSFGVGSGQFHSPGRLRLGESFQPR